VIRGCFGEMQTRERGVVMVVAVGCTEKTTRQSSVVVDIGTNNDGGTTIKDIKHGGFVFPAVVSVTMMKKTQLLFDGFHG